MYSDPIAYFLTFTTYGTWLHGRETGSVDRQHNIYGTPMLAPDPELEQKQRAKMKQPEYRLDENQRTIVLETILEVARHRDWHVWAAHVRSNHVHVVISANVKPEKVLNDLLTAARPMAGLQFQLGSLEQGTFQLKVGFLFCQ
jgi:acetolactate synthase regulatory subunit